MLKEALNFLKSENKDEQKEVIELSPTLDYEQSLEKGQSENQADKKVKAPEIDTVSEEYLDQYDEDSFWDKCVSYAKSIGGTGLEQAFTLYYATESKKCSPIHKATIYGALGYLISPIDFIPDLTPVLGFTDDIGLIAAAIAGVASCIDEKVKGQAKDKVVELIGSD